jgi:hypothetical protein
MITKEQEVWEKVEQERYTDVTMKDKYVCSICGESHYNLEEYVNCVTRCSKQLKEYEEKEKEKKRLEELNAALNRVKEAKSYFEQQLNDFKEKYPEEYELNFAEETDSCCDDKKTCGGTCGGCKDTNTCNDQNAWLDEFLKDDETKKGSFLEITYKNDGKKTPEIHAAINGKKVDEDSLKKLFEDPDAQYLAQMLKVL